MLALNRVFAASYRLWNFLSFGYYQKETFQETTDAPETDATSFSVMESTSRVWGVDIVLRRRFIVDRGR
jgi:hypothetical protein